MVVDNKKDKNTENVTVKQRKPIGKAQEGKEVEEKLDKDEEKAKQRKAPYVQK